MTIVRAVKGPLKPGQVLTAEAPMGTRTPFKDFGLCFLARSGKRWTLRPPISGYLLDFTSTCLPLPRQAKSVRLPRKISATTMDQVIAEAASSLGRSDSMAQTNIVDDYRKNSSPALKVMFQSLCSAPIPRLRLLAHRAEPRATNKPTRD